MKKMSVWPNYIPDMKTLSKILILRGTRDSGGGSGGVAYTNSIIELFRLAFDGVLIDQEYFFQSPAQKNRPLAKIGSVGRSLWSSLPSKVEHFYSRKFADRIADKIARNSYDLVVINGLDVAWFAAHIPAHQSSVYISHNIEQELFRQQISRYAKIPLLSGLLKRDARKLAACELACVEKVDAVIAISEDDRQWLLQRFPDLNAATLLPSFDSVVMDRCGHESPGVSERLNIGFLGNMDWWANRRSIEWFIAEILPHIPDRFQLHLFGKGSQSLGNGAAVIGHGFVDDLQQIWDTVDIMVQPIVTGAGINIKVAESLYNRVPMMVTPMALKGLPLLQDDAIVCRETAAEWIAWFNSDDPARLSTCRIRAENAALFQQSSAVSALQALL